MKPFNLDEAKAGKPVCTRDGKPARIISYDLKGVYPIVAAIQMSRQEYTFGCRPDGRMYRTLDTSYDLFMVEDEKPNCPFKPFDKVLVRFEKGIWSCALFSHLRKEFGRNYYECNRICFHECVPYNEETEHLIGSTDDAPEKYVIW